MAKKEQKKFQTRLILNKFLLSKIGMENFEKIKKFFKDPFLEKINTNGSTNFIIKLVDEFGVSLRIKKEELLEYDNNIVKALEKINAKRDKEIVLKYFQYFSLLFVEIYLDNYFANKDSFLKELNDFLDKFNVENEDKISKFEEDDINKLALWSATGSGKTILMHMNFHQISYYIDKYNSRFDGTYILLTPNEGLSKQHLKEFKNAGIDAEIYNKDFSRSFMKATTSIEIIENTKLSETDGDKTVAVSRFGSHNVLFVDEGHRGTSGDTWYKNRNEICENGFSFEYSATFGQAVKATNKKDLEEEYAKCIYFDYSYRNFYNDGFGKDYQILNLDNDEDNIRTLYLTASLLTFYQQKKIFGDNESEYKSFNISNPLMIFVGGSVNAIRTTKKKKVSDVLEILLFLNDFTDDKDKYVSIIDRILNEKTGLLNKNNTDVFIGKFEYLNFLKSTADEIYAEILSEVFHENISGSILHIEYLKGSDGEIRLRLGENEAFGLINVGDATSLIKLCQDNNLNAGDVDFVESLFADINNKKSSLNILIGSKKFSEGWNSWRVSSMGLMNIGKSEGSQIIQLFGRGVRLKGKNISLKRSSAYFKDYHSEVEPKNYKYLKYLETLNVFGVRADYMAQFKEYLEIEGINVDKKPWTIDLPIIKNKPINNKVMTLKVKSNLDFKRDGKAIIPGVVKENFIVEIDCYGMVQFRSSRKDPVKQIAKEVNYFKEIHHRLFDYDYIYFEIQKYKGEKNYYNFAMDKGMIKDLLLDNNWYKLLISKEDIEVKSIKDVARFNRIALALLKKYMDKKYMVSRARWESPLLKYEYIEDNDPNFVKNSFYSVEVHNENANQPSIRFLEDLKNEIDTFVKNNKIPDIRKVKGHLGVLGLKASLYNPYIFLSKENLDIKITPVSLNESEWNFVTDLKDHLSCKNGEYDDAKIYLIRNASKKGVGFFEDNGFYPDFILWIIRDKDCHMVFIEPHGMRNESIDSEKVKLHKTIKTYEKNIDNSSINGVCPILDSFILSPTKHLEMIAKHPEAEWNDNHVFFMDKDDYMERIFDRILK